MADDEVPAGRALANEVALVTGGARGIGRATAAALAEAGAAIGLVDLDPAETQAVADSLARAHGVKAVASIADVASEGACRTAHERIVAALGPPSVLVNNAGIMPQEIAPLHAQPMTHFARMMAVHVGGAAHFSALCVPAMRAAGFGRIVNLSSVLGLVGPPFRAGYATAKTALIGLTRALAVENARFGITVNAVAPGYVLTEVLAGRAKAGMLDPAAIAERAPVGRWGRPEEIARVIVFLADPASGFVTGAVWPVDGGYGVRGDPGEDIGPRQQGGGDP